MAQLEVSALQTLTQNNTTDMFSVIFITDVSCHSITFVNT